MSENRILIVDDSKTFLSFIHELLADIPNLKIHMTQDPRDAIKIAEAIKPDLILTDFEMPYLNGNEICKLIKSHHFLSTIPIMMLTSNNSEDQLVHAINNGADDFLCKSSKKDVMLIKIKSMLRFKNLIEENIKLKQLEAVNALVATSNHEFNNALFISNAHIRKLLKEETFKHNESILKINEMNNRILKVVKNLENLKNIEYSGYSDEVKLLKI